MNRRLCHFLCAVYRAFCFVWHPVQVIGRENVPADGKMILCANHVNLQDPMVLDAYLGRDLRFMAKKELFQNWLLARVLPALGAFPVSRGDSDIAAVRASIQILNEGGALGIFPEGHRYTDGELHAAASGVSLIALRAGAPVVPAYIRPGYRAFRRVRVRVGAPVRLDDLSRRCDVETLRTATNRVSDALRALAAQESADHSTENC